MIRKFEDADLQKVKEIQAANDLPAECLPDLVIEGAEGLPKPNPLFVVKKVLEHDGKIAMMCFLKIRSELYFFIDHNVATPEERWEMLKEFTEDIRQEAWKLGLDQMTAFVPKDIDASFSKRLKEHGFIRTDEAWVPYSLNII